jgi:hypothetical protein
MRRRRVRPATARTDAYSRVCSAWRSILPVPVLGSSSDACGLGLARQQHACSADCEREGDRVAKPLGEEDFGHREADASGVKASRWRPYDGCVWAMSCRRCTMPSAGRWSPTSTSRTLCRRAACRRPRATRSTVAGASSRRNSGTWSEKTTPNPPVASSDFARPGGPDHPGAGSATAPQSRARPVCHRGCLCAWRNPRSALLANARLNAIPAP